MSWLARSQLILAVLGLTILVQSVSAGNCSSVEPLKLERDRVWFVVSGGNASAITVFNGAPYGTNSIGWVLDMAVERKKTTVEVGRPEDVQYRCVVPRPDFKNFEAFLRPQLDPLEPRVPGRDCSGYVDPTYPGANDCGEVVAHIRASEFNCWQERAYDSLEGFSRERILVYFSLSDDPLFNMTISYELLDGNLNYTYNHSFGGQHEIQYRYVLFFSNFFKKRILMTVTDHFSNWLQQGPFEDQLRNQWLSLVKLRANLLLFTFQQCIVVEHLVEH